MTTCDGCGAAVRRVPVRGRRPPAFVLIDPEPADGGTIAISASLHGQPEADVGDPGPGRYRPHAETCPQMSLL